MRTRSQQTAGRTGLAGTVLLCCVVGAGMLLSVSLPRSGAIAQDSHRQANELATLMSITLGSAQTCGVEKSRLEMAKPAVVERINGLVPEEEERRSLLRVFDHLIEINADIQRTTPSSCSKRIEELESLERWGGLFQPDLNQAAELQVGSHNGQIEKLVPQPQEAVALGFLIWNDWPISPSTKSISEPSI
jgi:hypothetical protein